MSTDTIRANILLDTTSWTQIEYFNYINNNGVNWTGYTSANQIPRHITTCLADLCSSFGQPFSSLVVADMGVAETPSTTGIFIQPSESIDSVDGDFIMNDQTGSFYAEVDILVHNLRTSKDYLLVRDIALRLIYILDHKFRSLDSNQFMVANDIPSPDLNIIGDTAINPSGMFKVRLTRAGMLRSAEQPLRFCIDSVWDFNQP